MLKKIIEDKRILALYIFVFIALIFGFTYALNDTSLAINITTALMGVDEEVYGNTTFDTSNIDLKPILDSEVEIRDGVIVEGIEEKDEVNVVRIDFTVGGASTNELTDIVYDIALVDLDFESELLSPYIKWSLILDGTLLYSGTFEEEIKNGRLVLTEGQLTLPTFSDTQEGYHNYTFYMWFSDSCQNEDLTTCFNKIDQSELVGKNFSGKIEVELYAVGGNTGDTGEVNVYLNSVSPGSYVKYVGDSANGCDDTNLVNGYTSCSGKNANYVSDTDMGYCSNANYKFDVNGWRIAYIENRSAYLVSAGGTDCMCTQSDGTPLSSDCITYLDATNINKHITNLNNVALKYCNENYVYGGICNSGTTWAMNGSDFQKITGSLLSDCTSSSVACGSNNSLINNSGLYWIATVSTGNTVSGWTSNGDKIWDSSTTSYRAVRPVIKLDPSVAVMSGTGAYDDPYVISK